ncbi:MAG: hypothetical protein AB1553_04520 [Nitrospirota bacterium]
MTRQEAKEKAAEVIVRMVAEIETNGCHSIKESELREIADALK